MDNTRLRVLATVGCLAGAAVLFGCEDGSYFSKDTVQMKADKVGRLEAQGEDLRVYEFTPQTMPDIQCVFVAGENKGDMFCRPKADAAKAAAAN